MIDSRLSRARADIDDARTALAEIDEEGPLLPADQYNYLAAARQFLNSALGFVEKMETTNE